MLKHFSTSMDERFAEIGENRFIIPTSWQEYIELSKQIFSKNDVVALSTALFKFQKAMGISYKSEEPMT